jgi:uncharacterized membrane-anchored protein
MADVMVPKTEGRGRTLVLAGVGLQAAVLLGLIGLRVSLLWAGDTVLLRAVPLDPRELLRGDYVILSYECSVVPHGGPQGSVPDSRTISDGQIVYVPLVRDPDGRHWHGEGCTVQRPADGLFLRGRLSGGRIVFGIESCFVQEGMGKSYESAERAGKLWAEVAVARNGEAALRRLVIE